MGVNLQRLLDIVRKDIKSDIKSETDSLQKGKVEVREDRAISLFNILNASHSAPNRIFSVIDDEYFIHASALSIQCFNAILIDRELDSDYKPTKVISANTEMTFDLGRKVEDSIRKKILSSREVNVYGNYFYKGKELKSHESDDISEQAIADVKYGEVDLVSFDDHVIGHPDFLMLVKDKEGKKSFQVLEIKSISNLDGFKKDDSPKISHMIQVGSYIKCIQEMYDDGTIPYPPAQKHTVLYCSKKFSFFASIYKEFVFDKRYFLTQYENALKPYKDNDFNALGKCVAKDFEKITNGFNEPCYYSSLCKQKHQEQEIKKQRLKK